MFWLWKETTKSKKETGQLLRCNFKSIYLRYCLSGGNNGQSSIFGDAYVMQWIVIYKLMRLLYGLKIQQRDKEIYAMYIHTCIFGDYNCFFKIIMCR